MNRRLLIMLVYGFASGLPLPLTAGTLSQWMTEAHASVELIGLIASVGIAYTLKFLWSPLFDNVRPPLLLARLGKRRGWLLAIQIALSAGCVLLALSDPAAAPAATLAVGALVAFFSASQDIVIDAWRIESFSEAEQGFALAAYVWAYRMAMLVAGSLTLFMVGKLGWNGAMLFAASLTLLGLLATLFAPEPEGSEIAHAGSAGLLSRVREAIAEPLRDFLLRPGALVILAFVALFKLGEAMAGVMTMKFFNSLGFVREQVAALGPFSMAATVLGFMLGGYLLRRIGVGRALISTNLVQVVSMAMYVALAYAPGQSSMLYTTILIEAFAQGTADAAFLTYLSGLCSRGYSATQYALLSSLAALGYRTIGGLSGFLVAYLGWKQFYVATMFAALPAMSLMILMLYRYPPAPARGPGIAEPA